MTDADLRSPPITVVAPHPDDEVFGVGGIMRELVARGRTLRIIAVSDGEAAYGDADPGARRALVVRRADERARALADLGVFEQTEVVRLGLPDGHLADHATMLTERLHELAGPVLLATWRHDGHPDHEAVGRAAAAVARQRHLRLIEYVVWAPHRQRIDHRTGGRLRTIELSPPTLAAKGRAVAAFRSQIDPSPDGHPVVSTDLVERLGHGHELVFT